MNFSKESVKKRQKKLKSKAQRIERRVFVDFFKIILSVFVLLILIMAGAGFGMMKGILDDCPSVSSISIKPKGFKTVIYDSDNNERDTLSTINSNRIYIYYDDIPEQMINAFVAIEDERFWKHNGIDVRGIFRAFVKDVIAGNFNEGASTITQQLIKNQVFDVGMNETTKLQKIERKIQEQYLAIALEKEYTKEQLLEYIKNMPSYQDYTDEQRTKLEVWFTSNGLSYGKAVDSNGEYTAISGKPIDKEKSRRVEFRIVTTGEEVLENFVKNNKSLIP